ncbi:MAG: DNA polymerase III PolC-type [Chlamydiae bacterium]|nr:DNA polymerase III PolC-type [Chlamydiota bacterium]
MGLLAKDSFVCIDCETTGLEPTTDRLIEIAVVKFTFDEILDSYQTLIDPEISIPQLTIDIHHITDQLVAGKPKVAEILPKVLEMARNQIIVGHGIQLDIAFISEEAKRNQIPCTLQGNPFFDTLRMARLYGQCPVNSLERLRQHFNIADEGAHRAMSDVIVNIDVFKYLSDGFKKTEELQRRLEKPILMKAMPLGKHKGQPFADIPVEYLRWAANKDFDQDLLFSIRSELKKRKKGSQFRQSANPFSEL